MAGPITLVPLLLLCMPASANRQALDLDIAAEAEFIVEEKYTPGNHALAVSKAFKTVVGEAGPLHQLLQNYQQSGVRKLTDGTCKILGCDASRGATDCFSGQCVCQDGHSTADGSVCKSPMTPAPLFSTNTGGTCHVWGCDSSRGKTDCIGGRCMCQAGYATSGDGVCKLISELAGATTGAASAVEYMMTAGVKEPDLLTCPGDTFERGTMNYAVVKMVEGYNHFNMSLCRTAVQVYHGSPPPLVPVDDLQHTPLDNGYAGSDNAIPKLYAVVSNRQWRTHVLRTMAVEFVYSIVMPDLSEAAKRLGNLFHTLSDTFSASHVQRTASNEDAASWSACTGLAVTLTMGMDTTNFVAHAVADMASSDILFKCSQFFEEKVLRLWAKARTEGVATAEAANQHVNSLFSQVLCPALHMAAEDLDKPAGGTPPKYSASKPRPSYPRGLADARDADRIVGGWASGLAAQRRAASASEQRAIPQGFAVPPRDADACATPSVAHATEGHVRLARQGALPPQYLQPYPHE